MPDCRHGVRRSAVPCNKNGPVRRQILVTRDDEAADGGQSRRQNEGCSKLFSQR